MIFYYKETPIYYEQQGMGKPLVLIHGFLESTVMFDLCASEFAKSRTVISIDLPGHGKSGLLAPIHSMELFADVVHAILHHLNIKSAKILGHSMGGYAALAFVEKYTSMVDGLILLNSTTEADSAERKKNRDRAIALVDANASSYVRMSMVNLYTPKARIEFSAEIEAQIALAQSFPKEGLMAAHAGMRDRKDGFEVLKSLNKPKHIVAGFDDPLVPFSDLVKIAEATQTTLIKLNSGHMSLTENYTETIKRLHFIV